MQATKRVNMETDLPQAIAKCQLWSRSSSGCCRHLAGRNGRSVTECSAGETPAAPYEKRCGRKRGARPSRSLRSASRRAAGAADSIHRLVRQGEGCQLVGGTPTRAVGTTALPIWWQQLAHCLAALTSVCSLSPRGTSRERAGERGFALSSPPLPGPLLRLRPEERELSSRVNVASRHIP